MKKMHSHIISSHIQSVYICLHIHAVIESTDHMAAAQCIKSCRYRSRGLFRVHIKHQNEESSCVAVDESTQCMW